MKPETDERRIRRGYAILVGMLLAGLLIFNVDAVVGWFHETMDVVAIVPQTNGVRVGGSVLVEGVEAGRVTDIAFVELDGRGAVALELRLSADVRPVLRRDSRAFTARRRFIGESTVRLTAGRADSPPIEDGDTIRPSDRPSIDSLMARGKAFPDALDSLSTALAAVQRLAEERGPELGRLTERLEVVTREAAALGEDLDTGSLGLWLEDPTFGGRIDALRRHVAELETVAEGLGRYGADSALGRSAAQLTTRADRLSESLAAIETLLGDGGGFASRIQRDSALAVAVRGARAQIDSLRAEGLDFALRMFLP